ncbi:MAG TPA: type IV-A pilus assembly ATPase PilB [Methylomirabilota bacterium]|nr:type IV-A pilus assembly ATPase PilB [Methylomirabilota bacterium]
MRSDTARSSVSEAEARELLATAAVFESAVDANPSDLTALEALREIYGRLGDLEKLLATIERIEVATPVRSAPEPPRPRSSPPPAPSSPPLQMPAAAVPPPAPAPQRGQTPRAPAPVAQPAPSPRAPTPAAQPAQTPRAPAPVAPPAQAPRAPTPSAQPAPPPRAPASSPGPVEAPTSKPARPSAPYPSLEPIALPVALTYTEEPARAVASAAPAPTTSPSPAGTRGPTVIESARPAPATRRGRQRGRLGDVLVAEGVISPEQLADALREHRRSKDRLGSVLARRGLVSEDQLVALLSKEHGLPSVQLSDYQLEPAVLGLVPAHIARKYEVLPLSRAGQGLTLAMADPTNVVAQDEIAALTRLEILPVVASAASIRDAIARHYTSVHPTDGMADILAELNGDASSVELIDDEDTAATIEAIELRESADEAPVVRLVNKLLLDAIRKGASDLHWEPYEKVFRIRFRVDGVLHEVVQPPKRHEPAIISRLKIMASLDIAERRLPQDGRIKLRYGHREIDFRVSILPTIFGEKAVLRILDKDALKLDLTQLGFDPWSLEHFTHAIHQPYGMVLMTGPTGSGKTTTLYSAIHTINSPGHNIMTVEDPVEYNLKGVNQVQVNEGIGRTFASVLRSFLRQDPDVILVGETRDLETAQISVRAALTGHLVFTTLHTNDCPSTVARLFDMGIQPFLLSSSLRLIVAQRLARKICKDCKEPFDAHEDDLVAWGHVPTGVGRTQFFKGRGCQACSSTGMRGRVAIYEVMPISPQIRDLILKSASTDELREMAEEQGMKTLRQSGLAKVLEGTTTLEEVLRVTLA